MLKSRLSIISALLFAALPLHMSDADAAAAPADQELFYNENTKVVFADLSSRAPEDGVREIQATDVAGLIAAGATVDSSADALVGNASSAVAPVAPAPDASATTSATDADVAGLTDPNVDASPAASQPASDTASSAAPASPEVATEVAQSDAPTPPVPGATYEPASQVTDAPTTGELTAAASAPTPTLAEVPVDDATAPTDDNTGKVVVDATDHAEAKDRFAGILAALHTFEQDTVEKLKEELQAIGTLLHLHSKASTQAATTGDYKASDVS